jgi:adenylate cyclase
MDTSDPWGRLTEALLGTPAFTPVHVAQQAGVDPAEARRLWLPLGFPPVSGDDHVFTQADVEIMRAVRALVELQSANREDLLQLARVIGQSLARVADAQVTAAAGRLERLHDETPSDDAAVEAVIRRMEALAPSLEQFLGYGSWGTSDPSGVAPAPARRALALGGEADGRRQVARPPWGSPISSASRS